MRDFVAGLRLLGRGAGILARAPRLLLIGALPAVLTTVALLAGLIALVLNLDGLAGWLTPFADGWSAGARQAVRVLAGIALLVGAVLVTVVAFTALTLLVGGPFYEYIAEQVEDGLGGAQGTRTGWARQFVRGLRDSVLLVGASLLCTLPLVALGFVPVVGQTVVPVLAATIGGWLLTLELVGVPFHRRGLRLGDRHRALRGRRALTLGVGVPTYLLCAIPFAAIVVMPTAVVAGVLLAREVLPQQPAAAAPDAVPVEPAGPVNPGPVNPAGRPAPGVPADPPR